MKKIPTLFVRKFENHKIVGITDEITPGCEDAFLNGIATTKIDGSCCAVIDGIFYKRYDAKKGKKPPEGAIPCGEPDPITGHWPHWVRVNEDDPSDKWFFTTLLHTCQQVSYPKDGTYEAVGPHFQGNPYHLEHDILIRHGIFDVEVERNFDSIKKYLENSIDEGLVFWHNGEPVCKIKRSDFGLSWPVYDERGNVR